MSAFFLAINRNQQPFEKTIANAMLAGLDRFGPDGKELVVEDNFAIGYQCLWTVPEEYGEQQPLYDAEQNLWLVFYGRIDNRAQLYVLLSNVDAHTMSDARLMMAVYQELGEQGIHRIIGPFVFAFYLRKTAKCLQLAMPWVGGIWYTK